MQQHIFHQIIQYAHNVRRKYLIKIIDDIDILLLIVQTVDQDFQ